jgi:hypothetical protein
MALAANAGPWVAIFGIDRLNQHGIARKQAGGN